MNFITALSVALFPVIFKIFLKITCPYLHSKIPSSHPFIAPVIFSETERTKLHVLCKSEAHVGFMQQDNNVVYFSLYISANNYPHLICLFDHAELYIMSQKSSDILCKCYMIIQRKTAHRHIEDSPPRIDIILQLNKVNFICKFILQLN